MARVKENNQFYGKYFECCVVNVINQANEELYKESYVDFTPKELQDMKQDAEQLALYLNANKAEYIGNLTVNAKGDIFLPESQESIEIKYVSSGKGTYWNTSLTYFEKFGFNFQQYFHDFNLITTLKNLFGENVQISDKNKSPVSKESSSYIRHNFSDEYEKQIVPLDEQMREAFVKDLALFFQNNPQATKELINDVLLKNSATNKKGKPDRLIVYNYNTKKIIDFNWEKIFSDANVNTDIQATKKGLIINNIRIAIGWQNGNGLNNPTLRVFL